MVHAIGFTPHTIPINGHQSAQYDPLKGNMLGHKGLYGCGIAFPEQVTDPVGNVEFAVGLFKFMCVRIYHLYGARLTRCWG